MPRRRRRPAPRPYCEVRSFASLALVADEAEYPGPLQGLRNGLCKARQILKTTTEPFARVHRPVVPSPPRSDIEHWMAAIAAQAHTVRLAAAVAGPFCYLD